MNKPVNTLELSLEKSLNQFSLTIDLSLAIQNITGLFGHSGCGKSTLLQILAGLKQADSGKIIFQNTALVDTLQNISLAASQRNIGLVFQNSRLFPHLTVLQNLQFAQKRCKSPSLSIDEIIELTELTAITNASCTHLSGGEQQRVALARAILNEPNLLLLDEPLSALDQQSKLALLKLIKKIQVKLHMPMIYVSHNMAELQYLADNLIIMNQGKIIEYGNIHKVIHQLNYKADNYHQTSLSLPIKAQHYEQGLTELALTAQKSVFLPYIELTDNELAQPLRCFILANDISVTLSEPSDSSIVNHLAGTIIDIVNQENTTHSSVLLTINCFEQLFYVRISKYSLQHLALNVNTSLFIQFKANAVRTINSAQYDLL
jgi:molybdate transport system ATP-binding protein